MENKQQEQTRKREDKKRRAIEYYIGDEVLIYWEPFISYSTKPRKQRFRYEGPFTIVEVKAPHCVILDGLPERMPKTINVEYVHLFRRATSPELVTLRE